MFGKKKQCFATVAVFALPTPVLEPSLLPAPRVALPFSAGAMGPLSSGKRKPVLLLALGLIRTPAFS